jgi:hypothetical protein
VLLKLLFMSLSPSLLLPTESARLAKLPNLESADDGVDGLTERADMGVDDTEVHGELSAYDDLGLESE